jgi:hypothetical protein
MNLIDRIILACWLLIASMPSFLSAQIIANEQVFPVEGYSVFAQGYPLKVIPGQRNSFQYLEFWTEGKQGRPITNYYLQTYTRDYAELNYQPVTKPGQPMMQVRDLLHLKPGSMVVGTQERSDGMPHTVAAFFNGNGQALTDTLARLSCYDRKPRRNYREWIKVSPTGRYVLWVCRNGSDHFASLWSRQGQEAWHNELDLPYRKEKYELTAAAVDDDGIPYFLMVPEKPDPGQPIILLSYQDSSQSYQTQPITPSETASVIRADLHFSSDSGLIITGLLQDESAPSLLNGEKLKKRINFSHVFLASYDCLTRYDSIHSLEFRYLQLHPIPTAWIERYGIEGSNFADHRVLIAGKAVVMMMEEQYEQKKRWYCYDLALLAFDLDDGEARWHRMIEKRQRDRGNLSLLSYVAGVAKGYLRLVYLTERGASGKLNCTSIHLEDGKRRDKYLASNESARYLCFPSRSTMVSPTEMVLISIGNPSQNDYKLITVRF